jgi:hypothetical protein
LRDSIHEQWKDLPDKAPNSRIKAEVYYNLVAIEYELIIADANPDSVFLGPTDPPIKQILSTHRSERLKELSVNAVRHFQQARAGSSSNPDLRLASTIGELAVRLWRYDDEDFQPIKELKTKLNSQLPDNFIVRILRPMRVSRTLIPWAWQMKRKLASLEKERIKFPLKNPSTPPAVPPN